MVLFAFSQHVSLALKCLLNTYFMCSTEDVTMNKKDMGHSHVQEENIQNM